MADWKRLAKGVILADGSIGSRVSAVSKAELTGDGKVCQEEVEFLLNLRTAATAVVPEFEHFLFSLIKRVTLADGHINPPEAAWLKKFVFDDGRVDEQERQLLRELRESAVVTCSEFDALCHRYASI